MKKLSSFLVYGFVLTTSLPTHAIETETAMLGQGDSEAVRNAVIADINSASGDERRLLIDIAVNCDWPIDAEVYILRQISDVLPECSVDRKRYMIEYAHLDKTELLWVGKREIDRQLLHASAIESSASANVEIMRAAYRGKAFVDAHSSTFSLSYRREFADSYSKAQHEVETEITKLNNFYHTLGLCLQDAKDNK